MIKYTHIKLTPAQVLLSIIGIGIVLTGLLFAVYQMKYGNFGLISNAADPCAAYTKQKPLSSASGIVKSKGNGKFVWNMNGDASTPKVVVLCAGVQISRRLGGSMSYADIKVGDRVELAGWYGDATKNTILLQRIRDISSTTPSQSTPGNQENGSNVTPFQSTTSPFGVMISGNTSQIKVQTAKTLGAVYYRPAAVFLDRWNGTCEECDTALKGGLKLILTIRNNGGQQQPTTPPTDWTRYKSTLSQIVDKYKPEVLVIENEENSATLFYNGTAQQYLDELKAGCAIAHQYGIKCANGGLVSSLVVSLVADSYKQQGDVAKANEYLNRALSEEKLSVATLWNTPKGQEQLAKGKELLRGYKGAGADYMNFHWYVADPSALSEAAQYLSASSGLPIMSNEVGRQGNANPAQVTNVMRAITNLGFPYAVWFSMDINGGGQAVGLSDASGNLRSNGEAFATFINKTY